MRLLRLVGRYLILSVRTQTQFTVDFVLNIAQFVFYTSLTIIFWSTLLRFTQTFVGWSLGELIVLNGMSIIATGLSLFFFGFNRMDEYLQRGELDRLLCRPLPLLLGLLGEGMETIGAMQQIATGLLIMGVGIVAYDIRLAISSILPAGLALLVGAISVNLARGCVALLAIRVGRTAPLVDFLFRFDDFQKYPLNTFPVSVQTIFTWLLPLMFVSTYPAMILTGKALPGEWWFVLLSTACGWGLIAWFVHANALRHYESRGG